ncbi:MAG: SDR family NAD(P)-dependent oxidoreductase [Dehalobacterium sp.]
MLQLNIEDISSFISLFEQVAEVLKRTFSTDSFDYLINNAGIGMRIPFQDTAEEQFDQLMNTQFKGVYFFTQLPPILRAASSGTMLNTMQM